MVIDTSAIVAILFEEDDRHLFEYAIDQANVRLVSAVSRVELTYVVEGRKGDAGRALLERFFRLTGADIVAATPEQADVAAEAFRRFGKGRHPAALNIGDAFSYALAKSADQPLLFKGHDFSRTDIRSVLPLH